MMRERQRRAPSSHEGAAPRPTVEPRRSPGPTAWSSGAVPSPLRGDMEQRFGRSFADVRIHAGAGAEAAADRLGATAYTVGRDVVVGADAPGPASAAGRHLLAHELAHTVQQRGGGSRADAGHEQQAHDAASRAAGGQSVAATSWRPAAAGVQRVEKGTYVSTVGEAPYLDAGAQFFTSWGHPNVRRVGTMEEVVEDLSRGTEHIDTFRIVAHGWDGQLKIGMLRDVPADHFDQDSAAQISSPESLRKIFTGVHILSESDFATELRILQKDATTLPPLRALGADTGVPDADTPLGVLLRAILDEHFVAAAATETGSAVKNRRIIDQFNQLRMQIYGDNVVNAAAAAQQPTLRKAIAELRQKLGVALTAGGRIYDQVDVSELDAGLVPDPKKPALDPLLKRSVVEGGGAGPYVTKLAKVRSRVDEKTHVELRGCRVGETPAFLEELRRLFGAKDHLPSVSAPDLFEYFYRLSYKTYTQGEDAAIATAWSGGVDKTYETSKRISAGEMYPTLGEKTLKDFATRYGFNLKQLELLNPELRKQESLPRGTPVWLVARPPRPAGSNRTFRDFCDNELHDPSLEREIRAMNPQIKRPNVWEQAKNPNLPELQPQDLIWIVPTVMKANEWDKIKDPTLQDVPLRKTLAGAAPTLEGFKTELRGGMGFMGMDPQTSKPTIRLDSSHAADELGNWLAMQGWDPKKRNGAELAKRYAGGNFTTAANATYVEFMASDYPEGVVSDAVFPDDPRYAKHVIRRP